MVASLGTQAVPYTYRLLGNISVANDTEFFATAINDSGVIAGHGRHPNGVMVAWRWRSGVFRTTDSTALFAWGQGDEQPRRGLRHLP